MIVDERMRHASICLANANHVRRAIALARDVDELRLAGELATTLPLHESTREPLRQQYRARWRALTRRART